MANKQYKDFTAGAFAADQIIAQQSTSDDSYTKVTVPVFGLGDNVAAENRAFQFNGYTLDLSAYDPGFTGQSLYGNMANGSFSMNPYDEDSGDSLIFEMNTVLSFHEAANIDDSLYSRKQLSIAESKDSHKGATNFSQLRIDDGGVTAYDQSDEISPTAGSTVIIQQNEISIVSADIPTPNTGNIILSKTAIDIKVTDSTDQNYFHADKENMSLVGTAGIPFDFYNSENRLYMSLHLMNFGGLGNYATNAAAITAGLQVGDIYRTAGVLMIVI